jgi:hypothetical protein
MFLWPVGAGEHGLEVAEVSDERVMHNERLVVDRESVAERVQEGQQGNRADDESSPDVGDPEQKWPNGGERVLG